MTFANILSWSAALLVVGGACAAPDDNAASPAAGSSASATTEARPRAVPSVASPAAAPAAQRRVVLGDVDLTGIGHDRGSPSAPVVMIEFSDFGCPFCAQFTRETFPVIERDYIRTGKVFFKYVPFVVGMFPHAAEASRAVECAGEQGRFWETADEVYAAQREWKQAADPRATLAAAARSAGADVATYSRCYDDRQTDSRTKRATDVANSLGVRVTPSFVIDGRPVEGALPVAEFRKLIDAALASGARK
jgi:protein-disulfide isomerase